MTTNMNELIERLEAYVLRTRALLTDRQEPEQYWRGVLFGLELALLETGKQQAPLEPVEDPASQFDELVNRLIFDYLENLIVLCQARIRRDLLVYNARATRYELLKAIRQQTHASQPSDYELQANPDIPPSSVES